MAELEILRPDFSPMAPEWQVERWFNSPDLKLEDLRGKVVVLHAFQMLCPGCVMHGLPQAQKIRAVFGQDEVVVIGLHTVFEHHEAMKPVSLEAFLHEFRIRFPVAVDRASEEGHIPQTMAAYRFRGTPSLALIDPLGRLRVQAFGRPDDMKVGAAIASLIMEGDVGRVAPPEST